MPETRARSRSRKTTAATRPDAYQVITDRIIEALDAGVVPWRRPWKTQGLDASQPVSLATGKPYRGINVFLLLIEQQVRGYTSRTWATYKQIEARGGQVRKGEKSTPVVLWKPFDAKREEKDETTGETVVRKGRGMLLRYYNVFNLDQADGVDDPHAPTGDEEPIVVDTCDAAQAIVDGYADGPTLGHGGDRAFYSSARDHVQLPPREAFGPECDSYYATLYHELGHSTGHKDRLDRKFGDAFADEPYSREELVAELTACFLSAEAGIEPEYGQSAAYIGSWLRALADDRKLVVIAAAQAQKAADRILGRQPAPTTNGGSDV